MDKVLLIFTLFLMPLLQERGESFIHVTVIGDNARPQGGVRVVFADETETLSGECFTKPGTGQCDITGIYAPPGFIRGHLTVGAWGKRSVIWPGGELSVLIDVSEGLAFSHPPHEAGALPVPDATTFPVTAVPSATAPATVLDLVAATEIPPVTATTTVEARDTAVPSQLQMDGQVTQTPTVVFETKPSPLPLLILVVFSLILVALLATIMVLALLLYRSRQGRW